MRLRGHFLPGVHAFKPCPRFLGLQNSLPTGLQAPFQAHEVSYWVHSHEGGLYTIGLSTHRTEGSPRQSVMEKELRHVGWECPYMCMHGPP